MSTAGEIKVVMTLDDQNFTVKTMKAGQVLSETGRQVDSFGASVNSAERRFQSFGSSIHGQIVTIAALKYLMQDLHAVFLSFPESVIKTAGEIERMTKLMESLSTKTTTADKLAEARDNIKSVFDLAQNAPFAVDKLTQAFVKLKVGGLDPMKGPLQALVDAVASVGGDSSVLNRAGLAIQQMLGKGAISMEELRKQLGEAVPTAMQQMARGMNLSMSDLLAKVKTGTVESTSAVKKMLAQMELETGGSARKMMTTWVGMTEQLKTKWQLFQLAVANEGFFEKVKEQLKQILDAFDGEKAANLARTIGSVLSKAVDTMVAIIKFTREWGDQILFAGQALAVLLVANKLEPLVSGIGRYFASIGQAFTAARDAQLQLVADEAKAVAARAASAQSLADKQIAAVQKQVAAREKATAAAIAAQQEELNAALRMNAVELDAKLVNLAKMRAAEQTALMEKLAAEQAAADTINRLGTYGGKTILAQQNAKIALAAQNHAVMLQAAADMEAEIAALARGEAARGKFNAAQIAATNAANAELAILRQRQAAYAAEAAEMQAMATAMTRTAGATGILEGALAGLRTAFFTLVNPVTVIVGVMYGLYKAYEMVTEAANRTSNAQLRQAEISNDIKKGIAGRDALDKSKADIRLMTEELARLNQQKEDLISNGQRFDEQGVAIDNSAALAEIDNKIKKTLDVLKNASKNVVDSFRLVTKSDAQQIAGAMNNSISEALDKGQDAFNQKRIEISNKYKEMMTPLMIDPKKNQAELARLGKEEIAEQTKNRDVYLAQRDQVLKEQIAKYEEQANDTSGKMSEADRMAAEITLRSLRTTRSQLQEEMKKTFADPNVFLAPKGAHIIPEDPLNRLLAETVAQAEAAKEKLTHVRDDAKTTRDLQEEAWKLLQGRLKTGDLNERIYGEDDKLKGKSDARRQLANLSFDEIMTARGKDAQKIQTIIAAMADKSGAATALGALEFAMKQVAGTTDEVGAAFERLENGNLQKMTPDLLALTKAFDEQKRKLGDNKYALDVYNKARDEALGNRALANLGNFASEQAIAAQRSEIELITTRREKAEALYQFENKQIIDQYNLRVAEAEKWAKDSDDYNLRITQADLAFHAAQKTNFAKHIEEMKTPMQKLADQWLDVTARMEDATAQWAQQGVDAFMEFVKTGKFSFHDLALSIVADILKIQLQAQIAKPLTSWLGTLAGGLGSLFSPGSSDPIAAPLPSGADAFAMGGIMTSAGSLELNKYRLGGIANKPQLAMFGEGRTPEAYVPLPDGRSIPVSMQGGMGNVTINVINNSGVPVDAQQGKPRFDGAGMVLDIVLNAVSKPGTFRDNMKGALR